MASSSPLPLPLFLSSLVFLAISCSAAAANCSSQAFSKNRIFALCRDLPHLNASLHWTYKASNGSISIAFVAPPANPAGWVAWAINPTGTGMVGAQTLLAFKQANGSVAVYTYNITKYGPISPSPISFRSSAVEGESSDGVLRLFATVALPENVTTVNHVWQVGASVSGTSPAKHNFEIDNLNAKESLDLLTAKADFGATPPSPSPTSPAAPPPASGGGGGGSSSSVAPLLSRSLPVAFSVIGVAFLTPFHSALGFC